MCRGRISTAVVRVTPRYTRLKRSELRYFIRGFWVNNRFVFSLVCLRKTVVFLNIFPRPFLTCQQVSSWSNHFRFSVLEWVYTTIDVYFMWVSIIPAKLVLFTSDLSKRVSRFLMITHRMSRYTNPLYGYIGYIITILKT